MNECEKWLAEFLRKESTVLCEIVRKEAKNKGFTRRQLRDARKAIGVKTFHQFNGSEATPNWFGYLL